MEPKSYQYQSLAKKLMRLFLTKDKAHAVSAAQVREHFPEISVSRMSDNLNRMVEDGRLCTNGVPNPQVPKYWGDADEIRAHLRDSDPEYLAEVRAQSAVVHDFIMVAWAKNPLRTEIGWPVCRVRPPAEVVPIHAEHPSRYCNTYAQQAA